jgi:hypothetical protein
MDYAIFFAITYAYTAILWVVVLVIYNLIFEPFDFGPLGSFAWKSAVLVLAVALVRTFVPFGGLASLVIWWLGLMVIFQKDLWECRVLVILIWGTSFLLGMGITVLFRLG